MNTRIRNIIFFLIVAAAAAPRLFPGDRSIFLEEFAFQGQRYALNAVFSPEEAGLRLHGDGTKDLSRGMRGENILLGVRRGSVDFYIFWLNYRQKAVRLAYYDHHGDRSRLLPLDGFSSFRFPEIIEENGEIKALLFLADRSGNEDLFFYEIEAGVLTQLTDTPYSEKNFTWEEKGGGLEITTRHLRGQCTYLFDPPSRKITLREETKTRAQCPIHEEDADSDYYNTFIGFGDSITWGQIAGVQNLEVCYLTKMREMLAQTYGPSSFINLGIPAQGTYDGAQRVCSDLDQNQGFYFLLMLGVNDVWVKDSFSLSSSLENLEFIIDAALKRDMRVIVSTLTPRKDYFSLYQYYWDHLHALSDGILDLAKAKGTASIDTLGAFMDSEPPNGWKTLLEDIIPEVSKGNHPNAKGHLLIASLFADALVKFPPQAPQNISVLDPASTLKRTVNWDANYESDFSHFQIEFDFTPSQLNYSLTTAASQHTFTLFPFLPQLYFRIQAVDEGGRTSDFSTFKEADDETMAQPGEKVNRNQQSES